MTLRQRLLKTFYPLIMRFGASSQKGILSGQDAPPEPFYELQATLNNGQPLSLRSFRGKKLLLVNTASDCGYTAQYAELQQLSVLYADRLVVIGFPANDFKEQEKGSDEEIAKFCALNYGVSFPLARKGSVIPGADQQPVFRWLTRKEANGWNSQAPEWNFSKYLVDEQGRLTHYFAPSVSPLSPQVREAIER